MNVPKNNLTVEPNESFQSSSFQELFNDNEKKYLKGKQKFKLIKFIIIT